MRTGTVPDTIERELSVEVTAAGVRKANAVRASLNALKTPADPLQALRRG